MSAADDVVDLAFALAGAGVPEDYADPLWRAVRAALPWFDQDEAAGVHPLARIGAGQGRHYLSKHSRLTLRIAAARVDAARALCGTRLDVDGEIEVGEAKLRPLVPAKVLYSPLVAAGPADEAAFIAECRRQLGALGIDAQFVVGRSQAMQAEGCRVHGFSLLLHGLKAEDSLRVQRTGIGGERKRGCGIFVQHKSIAPVGGD